VGREVVLTLWTTSHNDHCDTEVNHSLHLSVQDTLTLGLGLRTRHLRLYRGL
jgi:hypothetical protein